MISWSHSRFERNWTHRARIDLFSRRRVERVHRKDLEICFELRSSSPTNRKPIKNRKSGSHLELIEDVSDEQKQVHSGEALTNALSFSEGEGYVLFDLPIVSRVIEKSLRTELVRIGEDLNVYQSVRLGHCSVRRTTSVSPNATHRRTRSAVPTAPAPGVSQSLGKIFGIHAISDQIQESSCKYHDVCCHDYNLARWANAPNVSHFI